tara:strand:- start:700 stop:1581 length:882 start_codon:yes stop_codon:yes gene_type:complete
MMGMLIDGEMPRSWRFIPDNFNMPVVPEFARHSEVLDHPESALVNMADLDRFQNFTGVKMGDFDFSADYRGFQATFVRSKGVDVFKSDQQVQKGEEVILSFNSEDFKDAEAMLLNFSVDRNSLEFVDEKSAFGNASVTSVDDLASSGNLAILAYATARDYEINLVFKAHSDGLISEMISLRSNAPSRTISSELEEQNINLHFESIAKHTSLTISPNPIESNARLIYETESTGNVEIEILATDGRILYSQKAFAGEGSNVFVISQNELNTSDGIIFISIQNKVSRLIKRAVMMH